MNEPNGNTNSVKASKGPLKILVAEDNSINLRLITAALLRAGHQVDAAMDGAQAVALFTKNSYDAVLMDIMMPVMDGISATLEIRKIEAGRNTGQNGRVKIIAITANAFEDDRTKFFEAGMDYYMNKPLEIDELHRILSV
ncbi:MAG: response regulator [Bacteroidota bacterium]